MSWPQVAAWLGLAEQSMHWIAQVFIVVFVTLAANMLVLRLLGRLAIQLEKTRNLWDDTLLEAARRPLGFFIWLLGLSWAAEIAERQTDSILLGWVDSLREIGVIVLLTWFLLRFVKGAEAILVSPDKMKQPMDRTTVAAISNLLRASIVITGALVILQSLGYSISGVLAFGGIGGIAVGFAAKDLLSNFFGGLMIYLDRPFAVGDWIRSPDKSIEGVVEHIGWRQTRIRTFDKRPLYVPNSTFTTIAVENPSRMSHRRLYETLGVRYDDAGKVRQIVTEVETYLRQHSEIDQRQTLMVNFNACGPSSLDFFIYCFTHTTDWARFHQIKQEVLLHILDIIAQAGAEVAFPTRTLHLIQSEAEPALASETQPRLNQGTQA